MRRILLTAGIVGALAAPAFAQMEVTCGDYSAMDNAQQMETIAAIESEASSMDFEFDLTADQIHQKLAAECAGKVDVLVLEVVIRRLTPTRTGPSGMHFGPVQR